jgi:hypothetical protein
VRHTLGQRTALAAGLAVGALLAGSGTLAPALAAGAAPAPTAAAALPAAAAAGRAGASRPLLLINGTQLVTRRTAGSGFAISLLSGAGDGIISVKLGGLTDEIPADALPYLGRGLDPSLFNLTALQRAEKGGRLPVRVRFQGRMPGLPGVKITHTAGGTADGYLTASSAREFGAALARQLRADHARASYGTDGLFGNGVDIALAGAVPAAPIVHPDFVMHTLTVDGTNLSGGRDNGDLVFVFNAANWANFGDPIESNSVFYHGAAKFSVPAGTYWAIGDFLNFTRTSGSERLDILPQFTVKRNGTVHLAERAASSEITTSVPRAAVSQQVNFEVIRGGLHGTANSFTFSDSGLSLWVSPTTRKPTVGTLHSFSSALLTSPPKAAGSPYAYNLDYPGPAGVIPRDQHYVAGPANLATVAERYYQDVHTTGAWSSFGGSLVQLEGLILVPELPLRLPGLQTQYFSAGPDLFWSSSYAEFSPENDFPWGGQSDDGLYVLPAGGYQTVAWNQYPLHPQPDFNPGGRGGAQSLLLPSALRSGNTLELDTTPFSDNVPGHLGAGYTAGPGASVSGRYEIDQNGRRIAAGNAVNGVPNVQLSPKPSVIRFTLTATRTGDFPLSTASQTVWTWRSRRQPGARVPADWYCGYVYSGDQIRLIRQCAVQPMMTLGYQVHGLALDGTAAAGAQVITVSAGHLQLARPSAITGASAQVSWNDGQSWQDAPVTLDGKGAFTIAFSAPGGVDVTLRVTVDDAAGGSIRETILRAYGVRF